MLAWELSPPIGGITNAQSAMMEESTFAPTVPKTVMPRAAAYTNVLTNDNLDLAAPGVRDNVANPQLFMTPYTRTNLFDNGRTANAAPIPNWEQQMDRFTDPVHQRLGAFWWKTCVSDNVWQDKPGFEERGQFSVPKVGFTALRHLKPQSTLQFI